MSEQIQVTPEQIRLMKHAIGFKQDKVKRGKYIAWRNYFACYDQREEWEQLVKMGLAVTYKSERQTYYHVSELGFNVLADLLSIKIVDDDD